MGLLLILEVVSELLKQNTQAAHARTEGSLVRFLKNVRDVEQYARLLRAFYGFLQPLESLIAKHLDPATLPDFSERRKSSLLLEDLSVLGCLPPSVCAGTVELPGIGSHADALGALYVFEGSTLGGAVIAGMLRKHIHADAFRFFEGYGENTRAKWSGFVSALNHPSHEAVSDQVVAAAEDTFSRFGEWLDAHLIHAAATQE